MTSPTRSTVAYDGPERRSRPRIPAAAVPFLTAHVAGGPPVRLIDLTKQGVQVEGALHMRPGSSVAMRFLAGNETITVTAVVVRSAGSALAASGDVTYHSALAFTDELTLCGDELDAAGTRPAAPPPTATARDAGTDYTMIVMDGRTGAGRRPGADAAC